MVESGIKQHKPPSLTSNSIDNEYLHISVDIHCWLNWHII